MSTDVIFITFVACCRGKIEISIRHACILKTSERDVAHVVARGKVQLYIFPKQFSEATKHCVVHYILRSMDIGHDVVVKMH